MKNKILISVIIPTYNRKDKLIRLIRSIKKSNYPSEKMEIIVVDNSSIDGTSEEIEKLFTTLRKKYYYAKELAKYIAKNKHTHNISNQTGIFSRYKLFFSKPSKIFRHPFLWVGMIFMKTCEFGFGGVGYLIGKFKKI